MGHKHSPRLFGAAVTECLRVGSLYRVEVYFLQFWRSGLSKPVDPHLVRDFVSSHGEWQGAVTHGGGGAHCTNLCQDSFSCKCWPSAPTLEIPNTKCFKIQNSRGSNKRKIPQHEIL